MKNFIVPLLIIFLSSNCTSNKLLGTWELDYNQKCFDTPGCDYKEQRNEMGRTTLEFKKDKKGVFTYLGNWYSTEYWINRDTIWFKYDITKYMVKPPKKDSIVTDFYVIKKLKNNELLIQFSSPELADWKLLKTE